MTAFFSRPFTLVAIYVLSVAAGSVLLPKVWGYLGIVVLADTLLGGAPSHEAQMAFVYGLLVRGMHVFLAAGLAALVGFWMRRSSLPLALFTLTLPVWAPALYVGFYLGFLWIR